MRVQMITGHGRYGLKSRTARSPSELCETSVEWCELGSHPGLACKVTAPVAVSYPVLPLATVSARLPGVRGALEEGGHGEGKQSIFLRHSLLLRG